MHLNICTYICLPEILIYQRNFHILYEYSPYICTLYLLTDSHMFQKHMPPEDRVFKEVKSLKNSFWIRLTGIVMFQARAGLYMLLLQHISYVF